MRENIDFDADDTLWHNEVLFDASQRRLAAILDQYAPHAEVEARLAETESRNISLFGYGIKGFTLSMVETAIELSRRQVTAAEIHEIVMMGKAMLDHPVELIDGVAEVLDGLRGSYRLMVISKGDLRDQRNKIDISGLAGHFEHVEIVSEKDASTYKSVLASRGVDPAVAIMVGNSLPSDVLPVLEIGGHAAHVPYRLTASFERHDGDLSHPRLHRLERVTELPGLLHRLRAGAGDPR